MFLEDHLNNNGGVMIARLQTGNTNKYIDCREINFTWRKDPVGKNSWKHTFRTVSFDDNGYAVRGSGRERIYIVTKEGDIEITSYDRINYFQEQ